MARKAQSKTKDQRPKTSSQRLSIHSTFTNRSDSIGAPSPAPACAGDS